MKFREDADGSRFVLDYDLKPGYVDAGQIFTVAWLAKFCEDNGIDPKTATVEGAYDTTTVLRWPKETE